MESMLISLSILLFSSDIVSISNNVCWLVNSVRLASFTVVLPADIRAVKLIQINCIFANNVCLRYADIFKRCESQLKKITGTGI